MQPFQRVITAMPLHELWDERGPVAASRARDLSADDLRELLRRGTLRFVVADVGFRPQWLSERTCFAFWKSEVQPHLAVPGVPVMLHDFPGEYCYFASEWTPGFGSPVVLLEKAH